jgi:hypothetical protein
MPDEPAIIPAEDWDDNESEQQGQWQLGPAGIEDAFDPLEAILGKHVFIFASDRYNLEGLDGVMLAPVPPDRISAVLRCLLQRSKPICTAMVSDGYTSHSVSPRELDPNDPERLIYFDPWNVRSCLQEGTNVAGVRARHLGPGQFSITWEEYERVIVAQGMVMCDDLHLAACPMPFNELKTTEFWEFFHIRETGSRRTDEGTQTIPAKTGGFQEFVDLEFTLSPNGLLHGARLTLSRKWIHEMGLNPLALDIIKSLIPAVVPSEVEFSGCGPTESFRVPNPDARLAQYLSYAFWELRNQQRTQMRFSRKTRTVARVLPFLFTYAGRQESADLPMLFSGFRGSNSSGAFELSWRLSKDKWL